MGVRRRSMRRHASRALERAHGARWTPCRRRARASSGCAATLTDMGKNGFVTPKELAVELGMSPKRVRSYLRALGLRKLHDHRLWLWTRGEAPEVKAMVKKAAGV